MMRLGLVCLMSCVVGVAGCGDDDGGAAVDSGPGPNADAGARDAGAVDGGVVDGGAVEGGSGGSCGPVSCGAGTYCCDYCTGFCAADGTGPACRPLGQSCVDAGAAADAGEGFDASAIAFADAGALVCLDAGLDDYSRACTVDGDCAVVMHMIDCCGTFFAFGIAASETGRFTTDEAACSATYPACGCAAGPTMVEDGTALTGKSAAVARCAGGTCRAIRELLP